MKTALIALGIFLLFVVMDFLWFQIAGNFFKSQISTIARLHADGSWNVRIAPALLVYVVMAIGVMVFVLPRATSLSEALLFGGLFGLVGYGIYDLTNLATLTAWNPRFALVDMTWGTFLCGIGSSAGYAITRFFA